MWERCNMLWKKAEEYMLTKRRAFCQMNMKVWKVQIAQMQMFLLQRTVID